MRGLPILLGFVCMLLPCSALQGQNAEFVVLVSQEDEVPVVLRSNEDVYRLEVGVGCLSLWRFEGKRVIISSPGLFAGVGSKLVLPDADQECRIWNSERLGPLDELVGRSPSQQRPAPSARRQSPSQRDLFTLYNSEGQAVAWIEPESPPTIYLWDGKPVAYLDDESVYGFNGEHLGWYSRGIVYDSDGRVVAAPAAAFRQAIEPAPPRGLKQLKPLKGLKRLRPLQPMFGITWSTVPARIFFLAGRR